MSLQHDNLDPSGELDEEIQSCRQLAGTALDEQPISEAEVASVRHRVDGDIAADGGFKGMLRSLRTSRRLLTVVLLAAGLTSLATLAVPRVDLSDYPRDRMIWVMALFAVLTIAVGWRVLRPLHKPAASRWLGPVLLLVGMAAPFVVALLPLQYSGVPTGQGAEFAAHCAKCLTFGTVLGVPVLLLALAMRRTKLDTPTAALAGVAAGLTGNLTLQVACSTTDSPHLLLGHAMLMVLLGGAAALWQQVRSPS